MVYDFRSTATVPKMNQRGHRKSKANNGFIVWLDILQIMSMHIPQLGVTGRHSFILGDDLDCKAPSIKQADEEIV